MNAAFTSYDVLGVPISALTLDSACSTIETWGSDKVGRFVCVRDVASLMAIISDPDLSGVHDDAAMITPDGMPLVMLGKLKGFKVERTCGPDLMDHVIARSLKSGLRHYFYGGKEGVPETLAKVFEQKYPRIRVVGVESPPFRPLTKEEDDDAVQRILASGADVVWVGISSPKQEIWMRDHYKRLTQTLIGVGAAFDFHSGAVTRAPRWMQRCSLEWLHRLISEPKRLWRRYLILAPKFVFLIIFDSIRTK
ncbi:WecB/TagA/CpsF family glycosyltransferase [Martelella alba]|nr:WecB/TagA/CpsF family glycosyltransferase [Martelella alba]